MGEAISDVQEDLPPNQAPAANAGEPPRTPYDNITDDPLTTGIQKIKVDESNNNTKTTSDSQNNQLPQSASESSLSEKELENSSPAGERSRDLEIDEYDFTNTKRGRALIFSFSEFNPDTQQKEREGAIEETKKLQVLMEALGFDVELMPNATKAEMEAKLIEGGYISYLYLLIDN